MKKNTDIARTWFCVLNSPEKIFGNISPDDMVNLATTIWNDGKPTRSSAVNYEIGDTGNHHMHMVLCDSNKVRFSTIQKLFKGIHIEPMRGSKEQAMDYIFKRGIFAEKEHTVLVPAVVRGDIKDNKGHRKDLDIIQEMLESGMTPNQIMDDNIHFRVYESLIRKQFYRMRQKAMPPQIPRNVIWHVGDSGTGKSHIYVDLCKKYGADEIYRLTDYENGGLDNYCAEKVLIIEEFRGNMRFQQLLCYLDEYPTQIHCRYSNSFALWNEVHVTSVLPPEDVYKRMVETGERDKDKIDQLLRRINTIIYHYKQDGEFKAFSLPMSEYEDYQALRSKVNNGYLDAPESVSMLFD